MSSSEALRERYREAATRHGIATLRGEADQANAAYELIQEVADSLRESGNLPVLAELLEDGSVAVRLWAASHLLDISVAQARPVLEEIAASECSILGLDARMTLREWEKRRIASG